MDPKMGFVIMKDDELADTRRQSLDLLYQPLLHPTGYALINILWRLSDIKGNSTYKRSFNELSTYLNVDMPALTQALRRVEGAGLLKTFYEHNSDYNFYILHLIQPRSAREFFKDDLLSVGLMEMIGDQNFIQLSKALIPKPLTFTDAKDLTRNFLEVYMVDHQHLTKLPDLIRQVRLGMKAKMNSSLKGDHQFIDQSPDFNFNMLIDLIKHNSYADPKEIIAHKHLIMTEHALYGMDEPAMATYIGQAASVSSNKVDFNKLKLLISKDYQGNPAKPVKTKYHWPKDNHAKTKTRQQATTQHYEQMLIKAADYYSPVQFLHHLKKQINPNGIITHQEEATLRQALEYSAFTDNRGVINILVYYSIAERKMPTLKSRFMQYMITAWTQANVQTPAEALAEIKAHRQKRTERWRKYKTQHARNNFNYKKQTTIKQKLPKWARSDYKVKLHPTSRKLQQKIKQQMKNLNSKPNHRKGGNK